MNHDIRSESKAQSAGRFGRELNDCPKAPEICLTSGARHLEWKYRTVWIPRWFQLVLGARRGAWGATMAAHRDERRAQHRTAMTQGRPGGARAGLTEAVAELRRLAQDPFLRSVETRTGRPRRCPQRLQYRD